MGANADDDEDMAEQRALDRAEAGAESAAATGFLEAKTRVLEAQVEQLHLGHFREWMYTAGEFVIALVVFLLFAALASAVYEATEADGLVIEAFSAPPDMAQHGLTGSVLASKLLDRLIAMQNATNSVRASSSFKNDWTGAIKLEIPDTGISLGEIIRYLHSWLGSEMHLGGEVYETQKGLAMTVRLDSEPGQTFEGKPGDLDQLMQQAAEAVFRRAQPYRYATYLGQHRRLAEARAIYVELAETGPPMERAWANLGLALNAAQIDRNVEATSYARRALADEPDLPNAYFALQNVAFNQGHDEDQLAGIRRFGALIKGAREWAPEAVVPGLASVKAAIAEFFGDYQTAIPLYPGLARFDGLGFVTVQAAQDMALDHDGAGARARLDTLDLSRAAEPGNTAAADAEYDRALLALGVGDWTAAIRHLTLEESLAQEIARTSDDTYSAAAYQRVQIRPWLAYAQAMRGNRDAAAALQRLLPGDCYLCTRIRGRMAAHDGRFGAAGFWFSHAVQQGPSLPFAETDWGAMLLAKGDLDGAIAKFAAANQKGPHFADPLEMWGEALIAKNRSDLALAKFGEAARYAPNWGRLHLKWGEALLWLGRKDEARGQFTRAADLDLSVADQAELARLEGRHG